MMLRDLLGSKQSCRDGRFWETSGTKGGEDTRILCLTIADITCVIVWVSFLWNSSRSTEPI